MALKATVFRADLQIADLDRNYYQTHTLTIARHPSETDERMMVRVLAYALHAHEDLSFSRGLSTQDEPDLWRKDLTGDIACWIDVGQPDERRLRKACGRAQAVYVYNYGGRAADLWWDQHRIALERCANLTVIDLPAAATQALAALAQRSMQLQCMIQERQILLSDPARTVQIDPMIRYPG